MIEEGLKEKCRQKDCERSRMRINKIRRVGYKENVRKVELQQTVITMICIIISG